MAIARNLRSLLLLPHTLWKKQHADHSAKIQLRQPLVLLVLLGLLGWYIAAPSPVVALSLALLAGLVGSGAFWAAELARKLSGRRWLETAVMQVGDELEEQFFLQNRSFLPVLWIEITDQSTLPGYHVSNVRAVGGRAELNWRARTVCARRGLHSLGPWRMSTSDPFGIFGIEHVYAQPQQILVYPQLAALPAEILPHRGAQGDLRPLNQPVSAETADAMMVRAYSMGDPLHHIHWGTTARRAAPYVKVFEPEASSRVWIVPDMDARVQAGSGDQSTEEMAVLLAASLAARLLQDKIAVGMFVGGDAPDIVLPGRGQAHLWQILERLAPLTCTDRPGLARTLEQVQPLISPRDLLVVITPSLESQWTEVLMRIMRSRGGRSAELILLDRASFDGSEQPLAAQGFADGQAARGFQARVLQRGDLSPMQAAYGALSRWEFLVSATGKAIARQAPRGAARSAAGRDGAR